LRGGRSFTGGSASAVALERCLRGRFGTASFVRGADGGRHRSVSRCRASDRRPPAHRAATPRKSLRRAALVIRPAAAVVLRSIDPWYVLLQPAQRVPDQARTRRARSGTVSDGDLATARGPTNPLPDKGRPAAPGHRRREPRAA